MPHYDKFHPYYRKLYPGVHIIKRIKKELKKSDRKMEYTEYDLKREPFVQNQRTKLAFFLPSREDSYERLVEEDRVQFSSDSTTPEEILLYKEDILALRSALLKLTREEAELIYALFFEGLTERELSKRTGIPQRTINSRRQRVLSKLKNFLENS